MPGIYEVFITTQFAAAHSLPGYPGNCARLHGHNWKIKVFVRSTELNGLGIAFDFGRLEAGVREILRDLDHYNLNDLPAFKEASPTAENLARFLYEELSQRLNSETLRVSKVEVSETSGVGVNYSEE
jgi:6-pyruvoyltetrahydropterin/6-carboxytetrahydropterin synthase